MESTEFEGTWFVLTNSAGKYICRTSMPWSDVLTYLAHSAILEVDEVYDYACILQNQVVNGKMLIGKVQAASLLDSTLHPLNVSMHLAGAMLYFFHDMKEDDQEAYKSLVRQARLAAKEARGERSVRQSGIVLPNHQ